MILANRVMKLLVQNLLKKVARAIVRKYNPTVVAITGSVGKTSTKEAIHTVLAVKYKNRVAKSLGNYNNEMGLPLTIIRAESGYRSLLKWLGVLGKGLGLLWRKDPHYPEVFVLEMGADRVGDIKYLLSIAPAKVGVLTAIGPSHLQSFESVENIAKEKSQVILTVPRDGLAVINRDNKLAYAYRSKAKGKVLTYGFLEGADVLASQLVVSEVSDSSLERVERIKGISFKLTYQGSTVPFHIPRVLGVQHVYAALAAVSVGLHFGLNLIEMAEALRGYKPAPGRMNLIAGIKKSLIVDDTYNAAPESAIAALEALSRIDLLRPSEKWAILGDMLELGSYTEEGHQEVGRKVFEAGIDYLVTVGEKARDISRAARAAGMPEANVYQFGRIEEAGKFVQNRLEKGDLILIKGSQGARMEKVVKELMLRPLEAPSLLVRQSPEWERKS